MNSVFFFTASILRWQKLLKPDKYKDIIVNSLRYLVEEKRIRLLGFVIMPNHLHLIWSILDPHNKSDVQRDFLKFTGQQIKFNLMDNHPAVLSRFEVNLKDRKYQFWQRDPLSIELYTRAVVEQKLDYIHNNPVQKKWQLAQYLEEYKYSSASYYLLNRSPWDFITHYMDEV